MRKRNGMGWTLVLVAIFAVSSPGDEEKESATPSAMPPPASQHWSKPYRELHELVGKLESQVNHHFFPEFTIIKEGNTIANISVDVFASTVLGEADSVLFAYRQRLQDCVDKNLNEYRPSQVYSYQHFAWSLDNYTKMLVGAIGPQEDAPAVNGVREKKVTTDRTWYALSRLLMAYLEEKTDREHMKTTEGDTFAADRALLASISDVARRVFRLDLNTKFDRQEFLLKGPLSQPVFRDLASTENGNEVKAGGEPLAKLVAEKDAAPVCKITLPPRKKIDKSHPESNDIVFSR